MKIISAFNKPVFNVKQLFVAGVFLGFSAWASAQCTPDTSCKDTGEPGQVCPDSLPVAVVNQSFEQTITFIAPDSVFINGTGVKIAKIVLDTISNFPPGISFYYDTNVFFPDTMYCVQLSGTPTDTGTYYLDLTITPYIYFGNMIIAADPVHDDTSLYITVTLASLVPEKISPEFSVIPPHPNPFSTSTQLGFTSRTPSEAELMIYDLTGKILYRETLSGDPGDHYFRFTGEDLPPGIYPFSIMAGRHRLAGKLVKIQ